MEEWRLTNISIFAAFGRFETPKLNQIDMIFLKLLVSFNFPGVKWRLGKKTPKYPNVFLGWKIDSSKDEKMFQQITPPKSFSKKEKRNINVVPPWKFDTTIQWHQMFKNYFWIPNCQVTSFHKTPGCVFFPSETSTHLVAWWCFSFIGLGSPRRMSFCFTGAT